MTASTTGGEWVPARTIVSCSAGMGPYKVAVPPALRAELLGPERDASVPVVSGQPEKRVRIQAARSLTTCSSK